MKSDNENADVKRDGSSDSRLNQTLKSVQDLLRGRTFPGKILLSRRGTDQAPRGGSPGESTSPALREAAEDSGSTSEVRPDKVKSQDTSDNGDEVAQSATDIGGSSGGGAGQGKTPPSSESSSSRPATGSRATDSTRVAKFRKELAATTVDLDALRELAWSGVPPDMRPVVWRLLLGYAPPNADRREGTLSRKRQEYIACIASYYDIADADRTEDDIHTLRQISVDCPRTVPDVPFFQQPTLQKSLERVLYIWAIRHPASGYVQGINDLLTPFLVVFLSEHLEDDIESWHVDQLPQSTIYQVEADCFWCLSKLLDGIQDHYTFAQPGIQRLVFKLKELVRRIDEPMSKHMEEHKLDFLQFAFRWFNCLVIREIPFTCVARLWDTYLAEGDGFPEYLVYVCASFLLTWTDQLQQLDFQEMVLFLQHLPTEKWSLQELEMVLSRAFMWRVMFDRAPNHLNAS